VPPTIYVNRRLSEPERRASVYRGDFHLLLDVSESRDIVAWARELIGDALETDDPEHAQYQLDVAEFVKRVGPLKSKFTNSERTKELCQSLIKAMGSDPEETYFDLPRLRAVPSGGYLTTGVSYAYKAHRDTWYSHPPLLVNYWIPVFDVTGDDVMSFWTGYWGQRVSNTGFDYANWVEQARFRAAEQIGLENRPHPLPEEVIDNTSEIRIALNAGDITMFSTCQLHATADNTSGLTRFSYDLRTFDLADLVNGNGPRDVDGKASGSTLGDFLRVSDLKPFEAQLLER